MRQGRLVAVLAGVALVESALLAFPAVDHLIGVAALLAVLIVGTYRYQRVARRETGRIRRVRTLGAIALGAWAGGLVVTLAATLAGHGDAAWLPLTDVVSGQISLFTGTAALLLLPSAPKTSAGKIRMVLDGALVALALFGLVWLLLLGGWIADVGMGPVSITILYSTAALLGGLTISLLLLVNGERSMNTITALAGGVGLVTVASMLRLYGALTGTTIPETIPAGLMLLGAIAMTVAADRRVPPAPSADSTSALAQAVPYVPLVLLVFVVLAQSVAGTTLDPVLVFIGCGIVGAVVGRQYLSLRVNVALVERLAAHQSRLTHQASHDPLTGLGNRTMFGEQLAATLTTGDRSPALLLIDLDGFKAVNDTRGHATGDELLVAISGRLRNCVGADDVVVRLGGDEFAVLLPGADLDAAIAIADRIIERVSEPVGVGDGAVVSVGASIGIAIAEAGADPEIFQRDADLALYEAKEGGRQQYRVADSELSAVTLDRMRLEEEFRRALSQHEIEVYYQPIVELESRRTTGVEALVRWRHPERGLLGPAAFLDTAEAAGLLPALDGYVLRAACREVAGWRRADPAFYVSTNLCAAHLVAPTLVEEVRSALTDAGVPASALMLEITESALVTDLTAAARALTELAALGVRIALDDFGTGYSSLSYLRQLPIHTIKIDRSFVRELGDRTIDNGLTGVIVGMAQTLGLRTVAEGVEGDEQAERLHDLRCAHAQGFLFARPMPASEIAALITDAPVPAADPALAGA